MKRWQKVWQARNEGMMRGEGEEVMKKKGK
jgi:hypothetical protein